MISSSTKAPPWSWSNDTNLVLLACGIVGISQYGLFPLHNIFVSLSLSLRLLLPQEKSIVVFDAESMAFFDRSYTLTASFTHTFAHAPPFVATIPLFRIPTSTTTCWPRFEPPRKRPWRKPVERPSVETRTRLGACFRVPTSTSSLSEQSPGCSGRCQRPNHFSIFGLAQIPTASTGNLPSIRPVPGRPSNEYRPVMT